METSAELFESGIQTEASDVRAHVSVVNQTIYIFPTAEGLKAIERCNPRLALASQEGVAGPTAEGWVVPVEAINGLRKIQPRSWSGWAQFSPNMSTSAKGKLAVDCVLYALKSGRFPFWVEARDDEREKVQIKGADIVVFCRRKIQVKCDYSAGERPRGTGNLFLQRAERNPLKRI